MAPLPAVVLQSMVTRPEALSYHPTAPWLAVCGEGQVSLWTDDGALLAVHDRPEVCDVSFGPDGTLAWAAGSRVQGGEPFGGAPAWELEAAGPVSAAAWLDAGRLAVLSRRCEVVVHHLTDETTQTLGDPDEVDADHLAANGQAVLVWGDDAWLFRPDGEELWGWEPEEGELADAALHPTEAIVAGIEGESDSREIFVCDNTLEIIAHLDAETLGDGADRLSPDSLEFLPDGEHLLALGSGLFWIWRWRDGEVVYRGPGNPLSVHAVRPDGARLAGALGGALCLWELHDQRLSPKPTTTLKPVTQPASSVDSHGGRLAVGLRTQVSVWSAGGLEHLVKRCGTGAIYAVGLVGGRDQVLCGSEGATAVLRDMEGAGRVGLKGPVGAVQSLAVAADGAFLVVGKRRWDPHGKVARGVSLGYHVCLLPDGERLVMSAEDFDESEEGVVELRTLDGELLRTLVVPPGSGASVEALAASPTGDRFAVGRGCDIALYDGQGELVTTMEHGPGNLCGLAFSPSGARLASASFDETVRLWSDHGAATETLSGLCPRSHGNTLAFVSEDVLAVVGAGGHAQLWNLTTGHRLTLVAASADKWVAFDSAGRHTGSKAGLKLLRLARPQGGGIAPALTPADDPTPDLLAAFLS